MLQVIGSLVGSPLSDGDWRLASLGVASGGIGPARPRNTRLLHTVQVCPLRPSSPPASGPQSMSTTSTWAGMRSDAEFEICSRIPAGADFTDDSVSASQMAHGQ